MGLLALSPATAAATVVQTPAGIQVDPVCNALSALWVYAVVMFLWRFIQQKSCVLPSSHMQSHSHSQLLLPGSQQSSQVSPRNPGPAAERAGKAERCKSVQGSEVQTALTKVPGSSRAAKDLQGLERKNGDSTGSFTSSALCRAGELGGGHRGGGQCGGAERTSIKFCSAKHFHMRKHRSKLKQCNQVLLHYIPPCPLPPGWTQPADDSI